MSSNIQRKQKTLSIMVSDELSIYSVSALGEEIMRQLPEVEKITVDLSQVTEMDSAGLQLLIAIKNLQTEYAVEFVGHTSAVLEVLDVCGMAGEFNDSDSMISAVQ